MKGEGGGEIEAFYSQAEIQPCDLFLELKPTHHSLFNPSC